MVSCDKRGPTTLYCRCPPLVDNFSYLLYRSSIEQEISMLRYALIFLVIALLASAFGMFGLSGVAMQAARILFFVFLVLLVISLISGRRGTGL